MKTRFFAFAALTLTLAACNNNENQYDNGTLPEGEYPVIIQATGLSTAATPVSRATVDGDWQDVTSVAIMIDGTVKEYNVTISSADNTRATLSNSKDSHYWTSRNDIIVSAWWPYDATDLTQMPVVRVAADQSKLSDFQKSDYISVGNQTVKFDDPILTFTHRTARVAVVLKPGTGFTSVDGATVSLTNLTTDNGNPFTIKTYNANGNTHEALTAPQTIAAGKPFIQVELGDGIYYFRPQNDVELESGYLYTYTVNVNATELTLENCTIGKWEPGDGENGAAEDLGYSVTTGTDMKQTYTVYAANGLLTWAEAVQNDMSTNCILTADIDMTNIEWTPIGDNKNQYIGTFDGGGHTITGLTVKQLEIDNVGLFSYIGVDGKMQNLTLENVEIYGGNYVGGLVGRNYGSISGCSVTGSINGTKSIGGVAGCSYGTIENCTSFADISGSNNNIGGVVGWSNNGTIIACYAKGNVSGVSNIGGVVGFNNDSSSSIIASFSMCNLSGTKTSSYVGGVAGYFSGSLIACYHATGTFPDEGYVGGILGFYSSSTIMNACYWSSSPTKASGVGSGNATKVEGEWTDFVAQLNNAIYEWNDDNSDKQCNWEYELDDNGLPTLKKKD